MHAHKQLIDPMFKYKVSKEYDFNKCSLLHLYSQYSFKAICM